MKVERKEQPKNEKVSEEVEEGKKKILLQEYKVHSSHHFNILGFNKFGYKRVF
ncbi:hypothetical protein [Salmonella enterica]|uniref:hypothetical protein n=1 Tax=Salmonella enterica TaxID=28901 RepID=UPI003733A5F0